MLNEYSPFENRFQSVEVKDLLILKEVPEGWYVEYKREAPDASSIAKSISAFANTYGGWLFYGISEESKENSVASDFPGIPRATVDQVLQRIRHAVAEQVNPNPYYEPRVFWGPCAEIGLREDFAIICVRTPWSAMAPHIHKKGLIYRRVADGSEPRPETDRFFLDQLWHRADDVRQKYKKWHDADPEFSDSEKKIPYVRILLVSDLWGERDAWLDVDESEIREMLGTIKGTVSALPFDTVYTSADGFIGRQLANNNPFNLGITWKLGRDLVSDVMIPLPVYTPRDPDSLQLDLSGYNEITRYISILKNNNFTLPRIIDLNFLFNVLIGVVEIQRRLAKRANWTEAFYVKMKLLNFWRVTPFVDVSNVIDCFEKFKPPMSLNSTITSPPGTDPESFAEVKAYSELEEEGQILLQTFHLFLPIARALGIPAWIDADPEGQTPWYYAALNQAGNRALENQRLRAELKASGD